MRGVGLGADVPDSTVGRLPHVDISTTITYQGGGSSGSIYQSMYTSVVDPDPYWIRIQELPGSGSKLGQNPGSGSKFNVFGFTTLMYTNHQQTNKVTLRLTPTVRMLWFSDFCHQVKPRSCLTKCFFLLFYAFPCHEVDLKLRIRIQFFVYFGSDTNFTKF